MSNKQNYVAAFIGTALEFYDFALFGLLAPVFSTQFYVKDAPIAALILSYGIFATGFLTRPLGGLFFGHIGDTYGRKRAMVLSILAIMIPTSLIGLLPTYDNVGMLAPVLLMLCRLLQGFSVGGEFSGAAIFLIEHSPKNKFYFSGSLVTASSVIGMLTASAIASISVYLTHSELSWRLPFLFSIPIGLFGFYIRTHTQETLDFKKVQTTLNSVSSKVPFHFKAQLPSVAATFGIGSFIGVLYYVPFVFMGHYHTLVNSLTASQTLSVISLGLIMYLVCIPFSGYLADKFTAPRVMFVAIIATNVLVYPAFNFINSVHNSTIILGELILAGLAGLFVGPANGLTASLFEATRRCRGVSVSLNLGISLFGGLTPVLLTYGINKTQITLWPVIWMSLGSLIAAYSVLTARAIQKKTAIPHNDQTD